MWWKEVQNSEHKIRKTNTLYTPFGNYNELHFMSSAVCDDLNCYIVGCGIFNVSFVNYIYVLYITMSFHILPNHLLRHKNATCYIIFAF